MRRSLHPRPRFTVVLAVVFALLSSAVEAQKKKRKKPADTRNLGLTLVWSPTTEIGELGTIDLTGISSVKIEVKDFLDSRTEGEEIGKNVEDDEPKFVTTTSAIAPFVTEHFVATLGQLGFTIVEAGGDVVLSGDIQRFYVLEDNLYEGDVGIKIAITKDGKESYAALAGGAENRWGKSYKDENYFESLSDSVIELVYDLASSDGFRKALSE